METIFINRIGNTNEPHKFRFTLSGKHNLKGPNKYMALANLSINYTRKNIKSAYNKNKFKISTTTWIDETWIHAPWIIFYLRHPRLF